MRSSNDGPGRGAPNTGRHRPEIVAKQSKRAAAYARRHANERDSLTEAGTADTAEFSFIVSRLAEDGPPTAPVEVVAPIEMTEPPADAETAPRLSATRRRVLAATAGAIAVALCAMVAWAVVPGSGPTPPIAAPTADHTTSAPSVGGIDAAGSGLVSDPTTSSGVDAAQTSGSASTASVKTSIAKRTAAPTASAPAATTVAPVTSSSASVVPPPAPETTTDPTPVSSTVTTTSSGTTSATTSASPSPPTNSSTTPTPDPSTSSSTTSPGAPG